MSLHSHPLNSEVTITSPRRPCFRRRSDPESLFDGSSHTLASSPHAYPSRDFFNTATSANMGVTARSNDNGDEIEDTSNCSTPTTSSMGASPAHIPTTFPFSGPNGFNHSHRGSVASVISTTSTDESSSTGSSAGSVGTRSRASSVVSLELPSPSPLQAKTQARPQLQSRPHPKSQAHLPTTRAVQSSSSNPKAKSVPTFVKPTQVPVPPSVQRLLKRSGAIRRPNRYTTTRDTQPRIPCMNERSPATTTSNVWYDYDEFGPLRSRFYQKEESDQNTVGKSANPSGREAGSELVHHISSVSSMGMNARGVAPVNAHPSYYHGSMQRLASAQYAHAY